MRVAASSRWCAGRNSTSAASSSRAANRASSLESSSRRTFFQRILAHSAARSSGAISLERWRSANASPVPSSSTTHFTAMLASMTTVFTARRELRAATPPMASVFGASLTCADPRPVSRMKAPSHSQEPDEEFRGAQLRPRGHGAPRGVSVLRSARHPDYGHADFRAL
jgi:hypothetical protein